MHSFNADLFLELRETIATLGTECLRIAATIVTYGIDNNGCLLQHNSYIRQME